MEQHPFQIEQRYSGGALILDLIGDLSGHAEDVLLNLHPWEQGGPAVGRILVLNFNRVPYTNSLGIAILIRLVRTLAKAGGTVFAYGVSPHYQKLFRMVGLTEYMMIYPDEYSVLQRIEAL